jgi:putative ABC transport system substrate-binding protein
VRRREFITLLGGAGAAWPLGARAQQPGKLPTIGVLVLGNPPPEPFLSALRDGLRDLGYTEGRNIRLEVRTAEGRSDLLREKAEELVRRKVDIIVTFQTPPSLAAKQATSEIPIVMASAGDPVETGLIASLARPGGNVTGFSGGVAELAGKSVELIRDVLPNARRIAVLADETDPFTKPLLAQIGSAAHSRSQMNAVITQGSTLRKEAADFAMKYRLPSFSGSRALPVLGGLMSYGANREALYRETAVYIDKILKGSKPADLPVAFPTKFELVINLKTAKALGIEIPPTLLARADEVIE